MATMSTPAAGFALDTSADVDARPRLPWPAWTAAGALIFLAAVAGVLFAPAGTTVAVWWPAAGLSVAFALLQPPRRIWMVLVLVLVATTVANTAGGRTLVQALGFGAANVAEVAVIAVLLGWGREHFQLSSLRAGLRFAIAISVGSAAAGLIAALSVTVLESGSFWPTIVLVAASHAAAVAMIAPFAALPPRVPVRASTVEMVAQSLVLVLVLVLVFQLDSSLPLSFAPYPVLAWAAFRFPIRVVLVQSLVASLAMLVLTLAGRGPFASAALDVTEQAAVLEVYLLTIAGFALVISAAQYELRAVWRRLDASARLLTGSVVESRLGLVLWRPGRDAARLAWANPAARAMLDTELDGDDWSGPVASAAAAAMRSGGTTTATTAAGRTLTIEANPIDGEDDRVAAQLLDVTELLRARQAEVEAGIEREAARSIREELERQRDDFLATTSHELRTPITSVVGYAELLAESAGLGASERKWVAVIERNAVRLSELVEDLLTLSGGATSTPRPKEPERIDCRELLDDAAASLAPIAERKAVELLVDVDESVALGSRSDAGRAVSNLLTNAIKFTPAGGRVLLGADRDGDAVRIRIVDTGPGMSEDELAHAFDRFYRAPSAVRDNVPGTGLGLAIVAELARRNGGSIELRRADGGGLSAELRLPAAPPPSG